MRIRIRNTASLMSLCGDKGRGCRICQADYPSSRKCRISGQNYTSILTNGGTSSTGKRQNVQLFSSYYEESNISDVDPLC